MPRPPVPNPGLLCGVNRKGGRGICQMRAGQNTDHLGFGQCWLHGGRNQDFTDEIAEWEAHRAISRYGLPREVDPFTALKEELFRTAGHVAWLQQVINTEDSGASLDQAVGGGQGGLAEDKAGIYLKLYQDERAHLVRVSKTCVDVGIAVHEAKLVEEQARLFNTVLRAVLTETGAINHPDVLNIVRKHLTAAAVDVVVDAP